MDTTLADQAFSLRRRLEIWANDYYFLPDTKDRATELPPHFWNPRSKAEDFSEPLFIFPIS